MPEAFRLRVMKALSTQLKTITPVNGYSNNLADYDDEGRQRERVFRGRDIFGATDPLPLLAVLEDPRAEPSDNGSDSRGATGKLRLIIQGFVNTPENELHPLDAAYVLSAEIIKALALSKRNPYDILGLGSRAPCISHMAIGQPVHRPGKDAVSDNAYLLVGVTLTLVEKLDDPFA